MEKLQLLLGGILVGFYVRAGRKQQECFLIVSGEDNPSTLERLAHDRYALFFCTTDVVTLHTSVNVPWFERHTEPVVVARDALRKHTRDEEGEVEMSRKKQKQCGQEEEMSGEGKKVWEEEKDENKEKEEDPATSPALPAPSPIAMPAAGPASAPSAPITSGYRTWMQVVMRTS